MPLNNTRFAMLALTFVIQNLAYTVNMLFAYYAVCVNDAYPNELPFTVFRLSMLLLIGCVAPLLSSFGSIYLHRIFGIKKIFLAYMTVGFLAALCCGISSKFMFWLFAICQFFLSAFIGNCQAQFYSFTNSWAPQQDVGIFMGVAMTVFDLPSLIGGQYYGLLCEPLGWRNMYYIIDGIFLVFIVLFLVFYTDNPADNAFVSPEELHDIQEGQINESKYVENFREVPYRAFLTDPPILVSLFFGCPSYVMYFFITLATPTYIKNIYHTSDFVTGNLCSIGFCVSLIVKLGVPIVDKYVKLNEHTKFYLYGTICTLSGTASLVLLGLAQNDRIWMIYVGLFLYGLTGFGAISFNKAIVIMTQQYSEFYGNVSTVFLNIVGIIFSIMLMLCIPENSIPALRNTSLAVAAYVCVSYAAQLFMYKLEPRPFTRLC